MKNIFRNITLLIFGASLLLFTSCDELSQLPINVPVSIEFTSSGTNTSLTETNYFCLSDYEEWRDNQDDIQSVTFLTASYWTLDGSSPNLRGDLVFTLLNASGTAIFTFDFGTITAANYEDTAFELQLTAAQIQALDDYLSDLAVNDKCFQSVLTITNITGDTNIQGQYVLNGKVEIVLEAEVDTGV